MNADHDRLERRLRDAGAQRREAEDARMAAAADLHQAVREAAAAGWTRIAIASNAGISRQTVHEILKEQA